MGIKLVALDPLENSPAGQVCHKQIVGDFRNAEKIHELAGHCDVLTVEIEHVNADAMAEVQAKTGKGQTRPWMEITWIARRSSLLIAYIFIYYSLCVYMYAKSSLTRRVIRLANE